MRMKEFRTTGMLYEIDGVVWTEVYVGGAISTEETCVLLDITNGKILDHDARLKKLAALAQVRDAADNAELERRSKNGK